LTRQNWTQVVVKELLTHYTSYLAFCFERASGLSGWTDFD